MAIIKAVSSKSPIKTAIVYVSKKEKTEQKLLSGYNLTSPETAYEEMQITKEGANWKAEHTSIMFRVSLPMKQLLLNRHTP